MSEGNILIIEDSAELLEAYSRILSKGGFNVFKAVDGASGMEVLKKEAISLVLLDVVLPDTNGFDLMKLIKSDPVTSEIFVILISADIRSPEAQSEGLNSGADGYLLKPITGKELLARINSYMRFKKTIDDLKASESRFKKITDKVFDGILIVNRQGLIRFSNPAAERMISIPGGKGLLDSHFGLPVVGHDKAEINLQSDNGFNNIAELRFVPIVWEDSDMWLISLRDITELKKNEKDLQEAKLKAEESDRLKSAFLANMSHEIRTPMNAIIGFSSLLEDSETLDEKSIRYIKMIKTAGDHLMRIINDILDIAKIESNQLKIKKQAFNINEIIYEIIEKHHAASHAKLTGKVKLIFNPPNFGRDYILFSDPHRLAQVFDNLVSNAVKFTAEGLIEIGYSIFFKDNSDRIQFYVKDSGIGMKQEHLEMIFERFIQAENNQLPVGTGLGLSISKGLISLLGGQIWVKSELGIGTTFYFTLPYQHSEAKSLFINKSSSIIDVPDFSDYLIYIAEDDDVSFLFMKEILYATKVEIVHAENGKQLIELVNNRLPDLILLDINMPVMNGFEALSHIRRNYGSIPVIAQTAYAMYDEKDLIMKNGADDYISKPISQMELLSKMNKLLKRNDERHQTNPVTV